MNAEVFTVHHGKSAVFIGKSRVAGSRVSCVFKCF